MIYLTEFDNVVDGVDHPITSKVGNSYDLKSACNITTMKISAVDDTYTASLNKNYGDKNCLCVSFDYSQPTGYIRTTEIFPVGSSISSNYTVSYWAKHIKTAGAEPAIYNIPGDVFSRRLYNNKEFYYFELYQYVDYGEGYQDYGKFLRNNASQTAYNGAIVLTGDYYGIGIPHTSVPNSNFNRWNYYSIEVQNNNIYRYYINGVKYAQQSGTLNPAIVNLFRTFTDRDFTPLSCYLSEYCVQSGFHGEVVPDTPIV